MRRQRTSAAPKCTRRHRSADVVEEGGVPVVKQATSGYGRDFNFVAAFDALGAISSRTARARSPVTRSNPSVRGSDLVAKERRFETATPLAPTRSAQSRANSKRSRQGLTRVPHRSPRRALFDAGRCRLRDRAGGSSCRRSRHGAVVCSSDEALTTCAVAGDFGARRPQRCPRIAPRAAVDFDQQSAPPRWGSGPVNTSPPPPDPIVDSRWDTPW